MDMEIANILSDRQERIIKERPKLVIPMKMAYTEKTWWGFGKDKEVVTYDETEWLKSIGYVNKEEMGV